MRARCDDRTFFFREIVYVFTVQWLTNNDEVEMASGKKSRVFENYADAIAKVEELASAGDRESDEFLEAAEAAAELYVRERGTDVIAAEIKETNQNVAQRKGLRKWLTIKDLIRNLD